MAGHSKRGREKDYVDLLNKVRALLSQGMVARAFRLLDAAWRRGPPDPPDRAIAFGRASLSLATMFGWTEASFAWMERLRESVDSLPCASGQEQRIALALEALLARLGHNHSDMGPGRKVVARLLSDHRRSPRLWEPWIFNLCLAVLIGDYRFSESDELLRHPPVPASAAPPIDRVVLLCLLGLRLTLAGEARRALTVYAAAERKSLSLGAPEGPYHHALSRAHRARIHADLQEHEQAQEHLRVAEEISSRLRSPLLLKRISFVRAHIQKRQGKYDAVIGTLSDTRSWDRTTAATKVGYHRTGNEMARLLQAAWSAIRAYRLSLARRLVDKAAAEVDESCSPRWQAFLHIVRGDLATAQGKSHVDEARAEYDRAQTILDERNAGHNNFRLLLLLGRGWLAFTEGNIPEAMRYAVASSELARERRFFDLEAQSLLLQSALLVEERAAGDRFYDRILPRLGTIQDPETLLRVVANLYIYTWKHSGDIDLIDLHLKQIEGLKERLDDERFMELYNTHVAEPILGLIRKQVLGG